MKWWDQIAMILVFWMLSFKPPFSLSSFTFIKRLFSSSLLSAIRVVSSAYLRWLIFLLAILISACSNFQMYHKTVLTIMFYITPLIQDSPHLTMKLPCFSKLLQSCPTLCDPMDCKPPGSSVRVFAISSSRGSSQPKAWTSVSYISCIGGFFATSTTWEADKEVMSR